MGPEYSQADVFDEVIGDQFPTIDLKTNSVLFSYGTTKAGKTHTIRGEFQFGNVARERVFRTQSMDMKTGYSCSAQLVTNDNSNAYLLKAVPFFLVGFKSKPIAFL